MPNKNNLDENKKKEIEKLLAEIKQGAPDVTKQEIEELETLLESIIEEQNKPLWKKLLFGLRSFSIHLVLLYLISMMVFGFFIDQVALQNKWLIFIVGLVVAFLLTVFEEIPRNPFRRHFISINIMLFVLLLMALYIVNRDIYTVFNFSMVWVFYIVIDVIIYILFDSFVLKKFKRG